MKKYLIILSFFFALNCYGQSATKIDQNAVVKDDSGVLLPYPIWQKMLQDGNYNLQRGTEAGTYVLHKLNTGEKTILAEKRRELAAKLPKPRPADAFIEGKTFKGEKFTAINGNKFDLRKPDGKVYVLNFWFINCPPCKREIPELNELVAKYRENKDVVFIAIALDAERDLVDFLKNMPFDYQVVDDGRYYATKYDVKSYPTHLVIGKDGLIKFSTMGLAPNTVFWIDKSITEQFKAQSN